MPPTRAAARNTACGRAVGHPALELVGTAQVDRFARRRHDLAALALAAGARSRCRPARDGRRPRPAYCAACRTGSWLRSGYLQRWCAIALDHLGDQLLRSWCDGASRAWSAPWPDRPAAGRPRSAGSKPGRARPGSCRCAGRRPARRGRCPSTAGGGRSGEGQLDELAHGVGLAGGEHVVVGLVLLQDPPHALDIVARVAPVALGVEIAEDRACPAGRARSPPPRG